MSISWLDKHTCLGAKLLFVGRKKQGRVHLIKQLFLLVQTVFKLNTNINLHGTQRVCNVFSSDINSTELEARNPLT